MARCNGFYNSEPRRTSKCSLRFKHGHLGPQLFPAFSDPVVFATIRGDSPPGQGKPRRHPLNERDRDHGESSQEEPDEQRWLVKPKAYGSRSRPSLHLERVADKADERTVYRLGKKINGRVWRFQARRLETGIKDRRVLPSSSVGRFWITDTRRMIYERFSRR